ncbi:MAG: HD domain-containing protein [Bacteroidales bacterium]
MTREAAREIFNTLIESDSLRRHCRSVELVMEAYARVLGEDEEVWGNAGLLHDADYEKYPDQHPKVIVKILEDLGEQAVAHAISAHYTHWGVTYETLLDKYLLAVDELTGFIIAASLLRPTRLEGLTASSVVKKLKTKGFAAGVDRDEIDKGIALAGLDRDNHIRFIIDVLHDHREELSLV